MNHRNFAIMTLITACSLLAFAGPGAASAKSRRGTAATTASHHGDSGKSANARSKAGKGGLPGLKQNMLLSQQVGRVSTTAVGGYYRFIWLYPHTGWPKTIRLLPNAALAQLTAANHEIKQPEGAGRTPLFLVSGQVSLYGGKPYLLLSPGVQTLARLPHKSGAAAAVGKISRRRAALESPSKILANLLKHHIARDLPPLKTPLQSAYVRSALNSPEFNAGHEWQVRPEGAYIWNRRARLMHNPATHQWFLAMESNGSGKYSPTIMVMPGPLLMEMQRIAARHGTLIAFRVSGRVTNFNGKNYLMLTYIQKFHFLGRD